MALKQNHTVFQCFVSMLQQPPLLGIHYSGISCSDRKERGVKTGDVFAQEMTTADGDLKISACMKDAHYV